MPLVIMINHDLNTKRPSSKLNLSHTGVDRMKIESRFNLELETQIDMRVKNLIQNIFPQFILSSLAFKVEQMSF